MLETDQILAGLDPEQAAIAQAGAGPVVVIAGAGTGKTRALTRCIAYGVISGAADAKQVLALTFTTKAAGEMRSRLKELRVPQVQARTFHSAALRQARFFWPQVMGAELPPIMERTLPMVAEAAAQAGVAGDSARLRDLTGEVSWAKASNLAPDRYVEAAAPAGRVVSGVPADQVARVLGLYERLKHRAGVIDLDDILLVALGLMMQHPAVADQVRATYRHLFVDEYQDVSPVQHALLRAWLGHGEDIVVVGDPAQSIHAFAGADPRFLLRFASEFPGAKRFELVRNYRCSAEVVAFANRVAAWSAGRVPAVRLLPTRPSGPDVEQVQCDSPAMEIDSLLMWLRLRHDEGLAWESMAVLYRVNSQSVAVEAALAEAGIPYTVRGAERFYDRAEVKAALAAWRGLANTRPDDPGTPALRDALVGLGWTDEPPAGQGRQRERWESWQALADLAAGLPPEWTVAEAVRHVDQLAEQMQAPSSPGVVLATLHSSKGLEFDAVAIMGVQEGLLPFALATTPAQVAEENRLLYVGVTRAKQWLRLSWDCSRRRPSRFLHGQHASPKPGTPAVKPKRQLKRCRVCGQPLLSGSDIQRGRHADCQASYPEALLDALKAWRLKRARADEVPAFVVFSDATLIAIAETRPATPEALLGISGIGAAKLERYGQDLLKVLASAPG